MTAKRKLAPMLQRIDEHIRKVDPPFQLKRTVLPSGCVVICMACRPAPTTKEGDPAHKGDDGGG